MKSKARALTTLGIVQLVAAVLLSLAIVAGRPFMVASSALGVTPTPVPPTEPPPTSEPTSEPPSPSSRLVLTKSVDATEAFPGALVTFVIRVCNEGDATARDVVVSDALQSELEVVSASASVGRAVVVGNGVRAEFGDLIPGACAELTIVARVRDDVAPGTRITNVATFPDQASNEVALDVVGLLPESGGPPVIGVATLLAAGIGLLAAGLFLRGRDPVSR